MDDHTAIASRESAAHRNARLLTGAQVTLWAILAVVVANGPLAIVRLTGRTALAGVLIATLTLAEAGGAAGVGRLMDRLGRRPGLSLGYLAMAGGGAIAAAAVAAGSAPSILVATGLIGAGAGGALLGRGAVAEMYPREVRGRAVGRLLVAGTVGAVGAPPLVGLLEGLLGGAGSAPPVVPWLLIPPLGVAGLACVLAMRLDPRDLAVDEGVVDGDRRPLRVLLRQRPLRAALVTVAVAQTIMVGIMGVATIAITHHGGSHLTASILVSVHLAGMFAFTPFIGAFLDRWGRRPALIAGLVISAVGAALGAVADGVGPFGAGFFLIGLGWSAAYVGTTAVVSDLTSAAERAGALGFTDLLTHSCSAAGGLIGGFVAQAAGFSVLGILMAALGVLALSVLLPLRERAPGRWEPVAVSQTLRPS